MKDTASFGSLFIALHCYNYGSALIRHVEGQHLGLGRLTWQLSMALVLHRMWIGCTTKQAHRACWSCMERLIGKLSCFPSSGNERLLCCQKSELSGPQVLHSAYCGGSSMAPTISHVPCISDVLVMPVFQCHGDLIGCVCRVICMSCGEVTHRQKLQDKLLELNPGAAAALKQMVSSRDINLLPSLVSTVRLHTLQSGTKRQIWFQVLHIEHLADQEHATRYGGNKFEDIGQSCCWVCHFISRRNLSPATQRCDWEIQSWSSRAGSRIAIVPHSWTQTPHSVAFLWHRGKQGSSGSGLTATKWTRSL